MFFDRETASRVLTAIQDATRPGGIAVVNVLIEGTTFMDMFEPGRYCLFAEDELLEKFASWEVLEHRIEEFPAGVSQTKRFSTLVARRPG